MVVWILIILLVVYLGQSLISYVALKEATEWDVLVQIVHLIVVWVLVCVGLLLQVELMVGLYAGNNYWHNFLFVIFNRRTWTKYFTDQIKYGESWYSSIVNHVWL